MATVRLAQREIREGVEARREDEGEIESKTEVRGKMSKEVGRKYIRRSSRGRNKRRKRRSEMRG